MELLLPAGSLDKLKVAVSYGADAVYLGAQKFGLRVASDNFTDQEIKEGVQFAHDHHAKAYVVLNGFLHDSDLAQLPEALKVLEECQVDAVIVSDLGVLRVVKKYSDLVIHLSTQASCLNTYSAKLWKKMGAKRVILGREISIEQARQIKQQANIEVEMFIHGSMCMAYSGNCTISNFTQGRDSNRGGCAHSCRFDYSLDYGSKSVQTTFMSSKDLRGIQYLDRFIEAGIDSVKVEGRMKSHLYVGTVAKTYREALLELSGKGSLNSDKLEKLMTELEKMNHRDYTSASLVGVPGSDSIYLEREEIKENEFGIMGTVLEVKGQEYCLVQVKNSFSKIDQVEAIPFIGEEVRLNLNQIYNLKGEVIEKTKPNTLVRIAHYPGAKPYHFLRKRSLPLN